VHTAVAEFVRRFMMLVQVALGEGNQGLPSFSYLCNLNGLKNNPFYQFLRGEFFSNTHKHDKVWTYSCAHVISHENNTDYPQHALMVDPPNNP
jgi:hypothetical protein